LAEIAGFPAAQVLRRLQAASRDLERLWLPRFAMLLATSETDAGLVRGMAPGNAVHVYPNALPLLNSPVVPEEHVVVFSGNFGYEPNIDAVRHFRGHIWPLLRQRWPELVWRLIGKNPEAVSKYIQGDPRIQATGPVANALESLASAQVTVVPVRAASGTRVKILEAWAASRPVVSTRVGAEGLPIRDGETALLADAPDHFAAAVTSLLASVESRHRLGRLGRGLYEREFTWDAAWSRLAQAGL
ncbi:MAG: glycosyltransferase, partial [Acidobacteriales bacterium]